MRSCGENERPTAPQPRAFSVPASVGLTTQGGASCARLPWAVLHRHLRCAMQSHAGTRRWAGVATMVSFARWAGNRGTGWLRRRVSECRDVPPCQRVGCWQSGKTQGGASLRSLALGCPAPAPSVRNAIACRLRGAGLEWRQWFRSRDGLATGGPAGCGGVSQSVATCHLANALAAGNLTSHSLAVAARPYRRTQTPAWRAAIRSAGEDRRRRRGCRGEPGLRRCGRAFRRRRWSPSSWPPAPAASAPSRSARPGRRLR